MQKNQELLTFSFFLLLFYLFFILDILLVLCPLQEFRGGNNFSIKSAAVKLKAAKQSFVHESLS